MNDIARSGLGALASGEVVIDRKNSHLAAHSVPADIIAQALSRIEADGRAFISTEIDFGFVIGHTTCVSTDEDDNIAFAKRPNRAGHTSFVRDRAPDDCSTVVIRLLKVKDEPAGDYVLITAYIGKLAPPEPWDVAAFEKTADAVAAREASLAFWSSHALIWDGNIDEATVTEGCPW